MADENTELLRENPWPARKFILTVMLFGYVMVMGVAAVSRYYARGPRGFALPLLIGAAALAIGLAIMFVSIMLKIRPRGNWTVSNEGLHFLSATGNVERQIPWDAINRMKHTRVSLVIRWTEVPVDPPGPPKPHREVLFVDDEQARALIATWHSRTRRPAPI